MSEECKQWRKERRAELLSRRRAITDAERSQWNASITRLLIEGFPFLRSMTLGFYWPFQGEFDPRFATRHFRKHSATTALPVVVQKGAPLQFREWYPGAIVVKGVFDLPMPSETRVVRPQALLIPPVGFDAQGYRLGYGGGYFDRTLVALTPHPLKIGVAFDLSRIPTIRPQPHDVPMDFIVTESGIYQVVGDRLLQVSPRQAEASAFTVLSQRAAAPQAARASPASS
ncbi:MAG: 5-formyltetrahydrofolate cyclo-ligase [Betaproteobacteria bacterium]|nr:5-formyltetrahydrofolate cyclo-ligase [Betaproteobacteria bacterium]